MGKNISELFIRGEQDKLKALNKVQFKPSFDYTPLKYDEDCKFINQCRYKDEGCYAGSSVTISSRCSKERINQMLKDKELKDTPTIHIEGSNNVQIAQASESSTISQQQSIRIDDIPDELISQFKTLIDKPVKTNRTEWINFFDSFTKIGGSISTLITLFKLFTS